MVVSSSTQPPPLARLPRPKPRRTKPWKHYLLWTLHNTIERTILIGVPAVFIGVPLLISWHNRQRQHPPVPAVIRPQNTPGTVSHVPLAQQFYDQRDYKGTLKQIQLALEEHDLNPDTRRTLQKMAMISCFYLSDRDRADSYFREGGSSPRLEKEFKKSLSDAIIGLLLDEAMKDPPLPQAAAAKAQIWADHWMVAQGPVADYKARLAAAALQPLLDEPGKSTSFKVTLPQQTGTTWVDVEWTFQYADATKCRQAIGEFIKATDKCVWRPGLPGGFGDGVPDGHDASEERAWQQWLRQERSRTQSMTQSSPRPKSQR